MESDNQPTELTPIGEGINIPDNFNPFPDIIVMGERIPCKKCGKNHGMGVEDMTTGHFTPIDICYDCFIFGRYVPITEQIHLGIDDAN